MSEIRGWAVHSPKQALELFSFNAGPLGPEEVEIAVEHCGICCSERANILSDE